MVGIRPTSTFADLYNPSGPLPPAGNGEPGVSVAANTPVTGKWTVTVITQTPHLRKPGENVFLREIFAGAAQSLTLNQLFVVSEVVNPTKLRFVMETDPGATPNTTQDGAFINPSFVGLTNEGGAGSVAHNNRVFGARTGYYHDTHPTKDVTVKKNLFLATQFGILQKLDQQPLKEEKERAGTLQGTHGNVIATYTTEKRHTLEVGQAVVIHDPGNSSYNGSCEIVQVPSAKVIVIRLAGVPSGTPTENATAYSLWQVGRFIVERNVIDQILHPLKSNPGNNRSTEGIQINAVT